jgi:hypothetical protein
VTWKHHADYQTSFRRYHSKESRVEKIVEVCYSPTLFLVALLNRTQLFKTILCFWRKPSKDPDTKPYISNYDLGISANLSVVRLFVALVQLYSIINILRANKLEDYSAYQLTLIPYALMSFVNIVSGFFTPSYPAVYMVRSSVMEEAERRGAVFEGWVGELEEDGDATLKRIIAERAVARSGSPEYPNAEGQTTLKDQNDEERPISVEDPNAGQGQVPLKDPNAEDRSKSTEDSKVSTKSAQVKNKRLLRRRKEKPTIFFGGFWNDDKDVVRSAMYFHHLGRSLPLIRFVLKNRLKTSLQQVEDVGIFSGKIFNNVFNNAKDKDGKALKPKNYYYILQIGNAKHRETTYPWMPPIMDLVMIAGLIVPWVTIYYLTGFRSPKYMLAGIFFMLWLSLGQFLPFILVPSWSLINLKIWRVKLNQSILVSFLCVFLFSVFAVGGFYFVGELRFQELTKDHNNCSKSHIPYAYERITDCIYN